MKALYTFFEQTILDNISFEGYDVKHTNDKLSRINEAYKIFLSEKGWEVEQVGKKKAFTNWLQGLPSALTVPFYYNEIVENAINAGVKIKDETQFCNDYWINLTDAFFTLKENL